LKNKIFYFIALGILIGAISAVLMYDDTSTNGIPEKESITFVAPGSVIDNSPAPVFSLPDLSGELIKLEGFRGRVVIINFWTTWCIPCKEEMPMLDEFSRENSGSITVLGINVGDSINKVMGFMEEVKVSFPILIDETGVVGSTYHVVGYPTTYFVDGAGIIRGKYIGLITRRLLQQYLLPLGINE
jgi:DsbE subfamily thiol:disulfide oxidoreductase